MIRFSLLFLLVVATTSPSLTFAQTDDEEAAFKLAAERKHIKARELAEKIIKQNPDSHIAHYVLGLVFHYGEANFPRALYFENKAQTLFEKKYGKTPDGKDHWVWHARLVRELGSTHSDLEHFEKQLAYMDLFNKFYQPQIQSEYAWPLMKLRRFDLARAAAKGGIDSGEMREVEIGLNALCAVEFEAGDDVASYQACQDAMLHAKQTSPGGVDAVDLTNFAEASRSVFKLDEAERVLQEATRAKAAWYGNPWLELSELYVRQGRFAEALNALKKIPGYRAARPPHVRNSDRNEGRRATSAFLLAVGRAEDAARITEKALVSPDRRAHNSRNPKQDEAIIALLDRRARLMQAEGLEENAAALGFWDRSKAWFAATKLRGVAFFSGRRAAKLLSDNDLLIGTFKVGTSSSAVTPPWLVGELVDTVGAGVVREAIKRAKKEDKRPNADGYYDAVLAEAALASGDEERAIELATRAIDALGRSEVLLRSRARAIVANALMESGKPSSAAFETALQDDPGVLRRLAMKVPVRLVVNGDEVSELIADGIEKSPRFDVVDGPDVTLSVHIEATAAHAKVCLQGTASVIGCGEAKPKKPQDPIDVLAQAALSNFHETAFAPKIDLSQADANSLDGTNRSSRNPLETMFDTPEP